MACAAVRTGLPDIAGWQAHCAAMTNAARCDGRCSALRWAMHCAAIIGGEHGHVARSSERHSAHPASVCESSLSSACRMLPAWPLSSFRGLFQAQQKPMGETFLLLPQNSTRRIRLPSFPGSNSPREPLDEVTTRSEAAQVILHRMQKEVWHSITLPFVKRNRGRKPPPRGNWHPASNKNKAPSARRRRELLVVV